MERVSRAHDLLNAFQFRAQWVLPAVALLSELAHEFRSNGVRCYEGDARNQVYSPGPLHAVAKTKADRRYDRRSEAL